MTLSSSEIKSATTLIDLGKGRKASLATLKNMLPDIRTALFFAKAYKLNYQVLSEVLYSLFHTSVTEALSRGDHSTDLQDYLVGIVEPATFNAVKFTAPPAASGEFLPEVWESINLEIAKSIAQVADKLVNVLDALPSKEGAVVFGHLAKLNRQRPTIGTYQAQIKHGRLPSTLVILDVSGSMTEPTIRAIIEDVVALSWKANATMAIVSNTTQVWEPGSYGVDDILAAAEYGGTQYETLFDILDGRDWGTVITIADYDSSRDAARVIAKAKGTIGQVLDISLVNKCTFLSEVVGQLASEIRPLLISTSPYPLSS